MKTGFSRQSAWIVALGAAFLTYAVYAATFSLPAKVSWGTTLSAGEWNKMVDSIDYLKSEVDVLKSDVAVLKSKALKAFVGTTTLTYDGAWVGGYSWGDAKCAAQFWAWARMCTAADFANGRPPSTGFYNTFTYLYDGTGPSTDCSGWTTNSSNRIIFWSTSTSSSDPCSNAKKILCCQ